MLPTYIPMASPNKTRSDAKKQAKAAKRESKKESTGWESPNIIDLAESDKTTKPLPEEKDSLQTTTISSDPAPTSNTVSPDPVADKLPDITIPQPNTDGLSTVLLTPKVQHAGGIVEVYEAAVNYFPKLKQYARGLKDNKAVSVKVAGDSVLIQYRNKKTQSEYAQHFKNLVDGFRAKEGLPVEETPTKTPKKMVS